MRYVLLALLVPTALLAGCPQSSSVDSGVDAPAALDAGIDAGEPDTGIDAPAAPLDAGSDAGASTDGSILPPRDSGDPFGDAGALGTPAWVALDVLTEGSCPALAACGGDEVGTWDVTGGCFELPAPSELESCPGATFTATGRARGRVTFDGTFADRVAQSEVTVAVFIPTLCVSFIGSCDDVADLIAGQIPDSACVAVPDGCDCEGRVTYAIDDMDGYTTEGDEIVSATLGKRWAYCVEDGALRYQDVSDDEASREPGIIELGMP